jgi:hypothetical protein
LICARQNRDALVAAAATPGGGEADRKQTGIGGAEITMVLNIEWTTSTRLTRTPRPAIYERLHWIIRPPAQTGTRASGSNNDCSVLPRSSSRSRDVTSS